MEVLSPSTEAYDRGEKFAHYRRSESLQEYVLIAQDQPRVEHFIRMADGSWNLRVTEAEGEAVDLPSIEGQLTMAALYDGVFEDDE
jgi:Uma2 family endonuclease